MNIKALIKKYEAVECVVGIVSGKTILKTVLMTKTQSGKVLYFNQNIITGNYKFTRKELEEAGFGWVFDCEGVEVEEVE